SRRDRHSFKIVKDEKYGSAAHSVETSICFIEFASSCLNASSVFESAGRGRGTEQFNERVKK
ncbi:hypothetical protein, partial [Geobacillus stearothermophilus]|uniref:hypothetical protein n=1 Tax=Geobacillus stearothermophilus TaxID=1422 RepID=UPI001E55814E